MKIQVPFVVVAYKDEDTRLFWREIAGLHDLHLVECTGYYDGVLEDGFIIFYNPTQLTDTRLAYFAYLNGETCILAVDANRVASLVYGDPFADPQRERIGTWKRVSRNRAYEDGSIAWTKVYGRYYIAE